MYLAPKLSHMVGELRFDWEHGVSTAQAETVPMDPRGLPEHVQHLAIFAEPYLSLHPRLAQYLLGSLPIDHRGFSFVDLGSGKGRMLMYAALLPFARVVGIELSEHLCDTARANIAAFCERNAVARRPEVRRASAHDLSIDGPTVFLLFNPFSGPVLRRTLEAIARHALGGRDKLYVVYAGPPGNFDDYWSVLQESFVVREVLLTPIFGHSY
ncbi:MAG: class I SAM-dependent methyltransferase, partial [Nannocystaceae bacterium]